MTKKIIGFAFAQQVGKTTAANYLESMGRLGPPNVMPGTVKQSHVSFAREYFARSLKDGIGRGVFGLSEAQLNDSKLKETIDPFWNMTPRDIMQKAGTEAMRNTFSQDIWIKTLQRRIEGVYATTAFAVDDVRFPDEADAIKSWGGIVVRINRNTGSTSTHASETALADYAKFDHVVDNNGTLQDLYAQLTKIVKEYI